MTTVTRSLSLRSRDEINEENLKDLANDCGVSVEAIQDVYACSPLQVATMVESAMGSRTSPFQFVFALAPTVDQDRFATAVEQVVAQTAILRSRIVDSPAVGMVQVVLAETRVPRRPSDVDLSQYLLENRVEPMSMGSPLFSTAIVEQKLVLSMHHAVMDHAAITLLMTDVVGLYYSQPHVTRVPYKEFVLHCLNIDESAANTFWASQFKGHPVVFPSIPSGHIPNSTQKFSQPLVLGSNIADDTITHVSSFIEAALGLTLSAYVRSDSVAYGLVLAGRSALPEPMRSTLGPTIVTVPVQINLKQSRTVGEVIKERTGARRQLQTTPALHAGLPCIRAASEAARVASHFQTILNIRPSLVDEDAKSADVTFDQFHEPPAPFALCVSCNLTSNRREITLDVQFDPVVLTESHVQNIVRQFEHILNSLMQAGWDTPLKALSTLNKHDHAQILDWNKTIAPPVDICLHELFHIQATRQPDAIAVEAADGRMTYHELHVMTTRVACELTRRGVVRGSRVPYIFEKSLWTSVAILAILKAGAACVPIEPSHPHARKADLIRSAEATIIITSIQEHERSVPLSKEILALGADMATTLPDLANGEVNAVTGADTSTGEDLAVILFTSGSTGTPKGVMLEHQCLASSFTALAAPLGWKPGLRVLQFAAHGWDASLGETFGALLFGGCLCVPSDEVRSTDLAGFMQTNHINWALLTPTVLRTLSPSEVPSLQTMVSSGEAINDEIIATWGNGSVRLFNGGAPSETSFMSAVGEVQVTSPFPGSFGVPIGCAIWLVNPDNVNELLPIGSIGEMLIEGPGVARGYLGNTGGKSNTSFIGPPAWAPTRPNHAFRFFRTGDLAKYNTDGSISFVGRRDNQVKVRGQRFELGELEAVILSSKFVRGAFATTKISAGRTEVVIVFTLSDDKVPSNDALCELTGDAAERAAPSIAAIEAHARSKLPSYMVPTVWIAVEQLPRTTSAKLDRTAVREWLKAQDISTRSFKVDATSTLTQPATAQEKAHQTAWATVLALEPQNIGQESVFVQLGGDSIRAMQVAGFLRKRSYYTTVAALLSRQTLAAVAKATTSSTASADAGLLNSTKNAPLTLPPLYTSGLHVERVVRATDAQAVMLATGQNRTNGYHVEFILDFDADLDVAQLQAACNRLIRHHAILRTVFIQYGPNIYQAILEQGSDMPKLINVQGSQQTTARENFDDEKPLVRFYLQADSQACRRLRIDIHHALYDAFSLGLIFEDLKAAYADEQLSSGPHFHEWVSHIELQDPSSSYKFWESSLQHSSISCLSPPTFGPVCGPALDGQVHFKIPFSSNEETALATQSGVVKAAWVFLLCYALDRDDVLFGEVSASRFGSLPDLDQVRGPCVNTVPCRAKLDTSMSLASLIEQIHASSHLSLPHHNVSFPQIIRRCTKWPDWTRFGSTFVYQIPEMLSNEFSIGNANVTLSHAGRLGNTADMYVIVTPNATDELDVELSFDQHAFSAKQSEWIAQCFQIILKSISKKPGQTLQHLFHYLKPKIGLYEMPAARPAHITTDPDPTSPSTEALGVVDRAWEEIDLLSTMNRVLGNKDDKDISIADCGGDAVTALLLSKFYRRQGYHVSAEDIVKHQTRVLQAFLLDKPSKNGAWSAMAVSNGA